MDKLAVVLAILLVCSTLSLAHAPTIVPPMVESRENAEVDSSHSGPYFTIEPSDITARETEPFYIDVKLCNVTIEDVPNGIVGLEIHLTWNNSVIEPLSFNVMTGQAGGVLTGTILTGITAGFYEDNSSLHPVLSPPYTSASYFNYAAASSGSTAAPWFGNGTIVRITFEGARPPSFSPYSRTTIAFDSTFPAVLVDSKEYVVPSRVENSAQVTILAAVHFDYFPPNPVVNETVTFNVTSNGIVDGEVITYDWKFGDGVQVTDLDPNATHSYESAGNYSVVLTVTDENEVTDTCTRVVNVAKISSNITLSVGASTVIFRGYSLIAGHITPSRPQANVTLFCMLQSGAWNPIETVITDSDSNYSCSWAPPTVGTYTIKANWTGDSYTFPSESSLVTVTSTRIPTSLSIVTNCTSTLSGFRVEVKGTLSDIYGEFLKGETIILSYTFAGIGVWTAITSGSTDDLGEYRIVWFPPATGNYMLKAQWAGNSMHIGASNTIAVSALQYENQYVFTVESNSTISGLIFDQNSGHLSFSVSGQNGTTGYTRVTVAKSLIMDAKKIKILVDGLEYNYTVAELSDSWVLLFTYNHSSHQVEVDLQAAMVPEFSSLLIMALFMAVTLLALLVRVRKHLRYQQPNRHTKR